MDLKKFDSSYICFCKECSFPFYSNNTKLFFSDSCLLCETKYENSKKKFAHKDYITTKYDLLTEAIKYTVTKHDLNNLLRTNAFPLEERIGDCNLLEQSRTDWEYLPIKKINSRLSEFDRMEYHGLNRIYSEHNLYEFLLLSNLMLRKKDLPDITANISKYLYSLFRFSCLNPPNPVTIETKLKPYNGLINKPSRPTETRKDHIQKHLHKIENGCLENKSSCRPWIRSTNFSKALHEINRFINNNLSPADCVCFRVVPNLYQIRIYYAIDPALIIIVNDHPIPANILEHTTKPYLVTCYTTDNLDMTLSSMFITHNTNTSLLPDFMAGVEL